MKKLILLLSAIVFIGIGFLLLANRPIPIEAPTLSILYNNEKHTTVKGEYNWMDKEQGGNTNFLPSNPKELVKSLSPVAVSSEDTVKLEFTSLYKKIKSPNLSFGLVEITGTKTYDFKVTFQPIKADSIRAPKDKGSYIYVINANWDSCHNVDYFFVLDVR